MLVEWEETGSWSACDRVRVVAASVAIAFAAAADTRPLLALHLDRAALLLRTDARVCTHYPVPAPKCYRMTGDINFVAAYETDDIRRGRPNRQPSIRGRSIRFRCGGEYARWGRGPGRKRGRVPRVVHVRRRRRPARGARAAAARQPLRGQDLPHTPEGDQDDAEADLRLMDRARLPLPR